MPNSPADRPEFRSFQLRRELLEGLAEMGYSTATPVQALAIPAVQEGGDLLVQAKTGSGKTLAFGLPLLNRIDLHRPDCQVLVVVPTRELALQVATELERVGATLGVVIGAVFGGIPIKEHVVTAQWATVLVGTPGRLRDLLERGMLRLDHVRSVVLDEADEMLDMGFKVDLEFILEAARSRQQTLFFSATFPPEILKIAKRTLKDPKRLQAQPEEQTPTTIEHRVVRVGQDKKFEALARLLKGEHVTQGIIFCNTKTETPWLTRKLRAQGFSAECIHGDMSQQDRLRVMDRYKADAFKLLVATEVAARGLDIAGISHVVNYSVPNNPEVYFHRCGRTGRAGRSGVAITMVTPGEERNFTRIEEALAARRPKGAKRQAAKPEASVNPAPAQPSRSSVPEEHGLPARQAGRRELAVRSRDMVGPREERSRGRQRGLKVAAEDLVAYAGGAAEAHHALARHLLHAHDPVTLVSALLAVHPLVHEAARHQGS
ncbi:MAG: DEAD/DEAH box helicase [Candidatus Sericytochromatia bacterium]|nr:DEAD/DEAH box helicase [Candidatus Sericytochromatia bacterium]